MSSPQEELAQHPLVRKLCSTDVLLRSRHGRALSLPAARWQVEPLPPGKEAFAQGVRVYRCVGAAIGDPAAGTAFRPIRAPQGG
jgi:hypothetical protein